MKKQNRLQMWVIAFFALLVATFSCSRVNTEDVETSTSPVRAQVLDINENEGVLPEDIAGLLAVEYKGTKSEGREVKEIIPIFGSEGDTLMFAVNYKDNRGFTLISATRNYYPILAEAPEGNYRADDDNPGFAMWLDETKAVVAHQRTAPDSATLWQYRSSWLKYCGLRDLEQGTKSNEVFNLMNQSVGQWRSQGYTVIEYGRFGGSTAAMGQAVSQYANHVYDPSVWAFVLTKSTVNQVTSGQLITTNWHQLRPFNNGLALISGSDTEHIPVGCVNIAMGQIMKYHRYPTYFNWGQIDRYGTDIASFLSTLYTATNSFFSNGQTWSTLLDARSALLGYGYSGQMSVTGYDNSLIQSNLIRYRPVIIAGTNPNSGGHAWVCDGYESSSTSSDYTVMALEDCPSSMEPTRYNSIYSSRDITAVSSVKHHMNWGWEELRPNDYNGWYLANYDRDYSQGKQLLVNIFY